MSGFRRTPAPQRPPHPAAAPRSLGQRLAGLPVWVQAIAALIPAVLAVLAYLGLNPGTPADTAPPVPEPALRVSIGEVTKEPEVLRVHGAYVDLDPDSESVVVMLIDDTGGERKYTTVGVDYAPAAIPRGAGEDGTFTAGIPVTGALDGYSVQGSIARIPRGAGFDSGVLAELREKGPAASVVVESTMVVEVDTAQP